MKLRDRRRIGQPCFGTVRWRLVAVIAVSGLLLAACSATPASAPPESASQGPTAAPAPDLSERPLVWFAPLPPLPTTEDRPYVGADDFMQLFEPGAAWDRAAELVGVFKLYGEWVAYVATDAQLRQAVSAIQRRGMALAVEAGPLTAPPECGDGVESFAGIVEGRRIAQRIRNAGGRVDVIALDEPFYYANLYDGPGACHWPAERVARQVADYVSVMRSYFPQLVVGDTEPATGPVDHAVVAGWLDSYRHVADEPLAFFHLDVDFGRPDWVDNAVNIQRVTREQSVAFGCIYHGGNAPSDKSWVALAGERSQAFEAAAGGRPDHVIFQSWMARPDRTLPDSEPDTFTGLIVRYFDDAAGLGLRPEDNLALRRPAQASTSLPDNPAAAAVDGDPDTWWGAGAFAPQWIEVDLGAPRTIAEVRLQTSQDPAGQTEHRIIGASTPGASGTLLYTARGETSDGQVLVIRPDSPWTGIRYLRIETTRSPSWVSWREIEVVPG